MDQQTKGQDASYLQLSGLNQAVDLLQVERHQFATLQSLFPYEIGHLRRFPGKQVEILFANEVRGIFQLQTPFGHLSRLVQTTGGVYTDEDPPTPYTPITPAPTFIPSTLGFDYVLIQDQKAAGTDAGGSTVGAWRTRDLNTEVSDSANLAVLAANQITLAAGTYFVTIKASTQGVDRNYTRLQNITDATTLIVGSDEYNFQNADTISGSSWVMGVIVLAAPKVLEVQHRFQTAHALTGLGLNVNLDATRVEVYTSIEFIKVP